MAYPYGGYGYGFSPSYMPTPGGLTPGRVGAVESTPTTPFEKTSGKLQVHEQGVQASWIGAGVGAGAVGLAGAGLGYKLFGKNGKGLAKGSGKGALFGGLLGALGGAMAGIFAGKSLGQAKATESDARDDGKFNGSDRGDFQSDRTYNGVF